MADRGSFSPDDASGALGSPIETPERFLEVDRETRRTMRERVSGLALAVLALGGALLIGAYSLSALIYAGFGLVFCLLAYSVLTTDFSGDARRGRRE